MSRKSIIGALAAAALAGSLGNQMWAAGWADDSTPAAVVGAPERQSPQPTLIPDEPFWSYPLCEVEDASSGPVPCLWPADRVGNGEGNTFYVEHGPKGTLCFHYPNPVAERKWGGCE